MTKEQAFVKKNVNAYEYLLLEKLINGDETVPIMVPVVNSLISKGYLSREMKPLPNAFKIIPKARDYKSLAIKVRELFPKGKKAGRYPWRASVAVVEDRLRKLESMGIDEYTDEQVIKATEDYINGFNEIDMHNGMAILIYFILKDGNSMLINELESEDEAPQVGSVSFGIEL